MKSIFLHFDNGEKLLFSKFGLTTARFYSLKFIRSNPGISNIDLSKLMVCTKGNTTRLVQGLLQEDLVIRLENPKDRRSYQLFLTKSGEELFKEVNLGYQDYINCLISRLNEDQLMLFTEVSKNIERKLSITICD
jgi:DNA-binding MarR family transcriptional regulator